MIHIAGSCRRTFLFPADLPTAFAYFSDTSRILLYLPHISVVQAYAYDRFRLLYSTTELGLYRIRIICDLRTKLDTNRKQPGVYLVPLEGTRPVKSEAGATSATGQGHYSSVSIFRAAGGQTRINYSMTLQVKLPTPLALRVLPAAVVNSIAANVTNGRIREIATGFIERSIEAFPEWLDEMQHAGLRKRTGSS